MCLFGLFLGLILLFALAGLPVLLFQAGQQRRRSESSDELIRRRAKHEVAETERRTMQAMLAAELMAARAAAEPGRSSDIEGSAVDLRDQR